LAEQDLPDPWIVADELIRRGQVDVAEAFAKAAPRADVEGLPTYVVSRKGRPDDAAARARCAAAAAAVHRGEAEKVLDALGPATAGPIDDVVGVRSQTFRGAALSMSERHEEAAAALLVAAASALRLGWLDAAFTTYDQGAESLQNVGKLDAARDASEHALALAVRRGDRAGEMSVLDRLGMIHRGLRDDAKALDAWERALTVASKVGDPEAVATTTIRIGVVHERLGNYAKAVEFLQRGLEGAEAAGLRPWVATALSGLTVVYTRVGDHAKALAAGERTLAAYEALGDESDVAEALDHLGSIYDLLGNLARASECYGRALALNEKAGDRAGVAAALTNLGVVRMRLGDHAKAIEAHERALAAFEASGDRAGAIAARVNLATVYKQMGELEKALALFEQGARDAQAIGHRQWGADALAGVCSVYAARGEHAKVLEYGARELELREELGDRPGLISTLSDAAAARSGLGDWAGAVAAARRGAALVPQVVAGLADEQSATARTRFAHVFEIGARAAARANDAEAVLGFLESGRAGSLLEALGSRTALQAALVPAALADEEARAHAREAAALGALRRALDAGDLATSRARRRELDEARAAVESVVERIQREAKAAANVVHFAPDDLATIRRRLGPGEALVAYGLSDESSLAVVVTGTGATTVSLPAIADVDGACDALLAAIDEGRDAATPDASAGAVSRAADALRDLVVKPLGLDAGTKRVLVSPDGALSYVPFALLAPEREIAYVTSGTTYGLLLQDGPPRGEGVLALGDPDYESPIAGPAPGADARRGGAGRLARLPATGREASSIGGTVLLQKDATERGLRDAVAKRSRWRAVHFACHGLIDADRPSFSSLALTPQGADDGFLTVAEVFRSKIPADLVVLSACETARGKVVQGEGIMGLTRAFMFAGAPRIICSLWKVDDSATQALMTKFYELWNPTDGKAGLPAAEALRKAQGFVKSQEKWKHPYFWAAWVLWGLPE